MPNIILGRETCPKSSIHPMFYNYKASKMIGWEKWQRNLSGIHVASR